MTFKYFHFFNQYIINYIHLIREYIASYFLMLNDYLLFELGCMELDGGQGRGKGIS